MDNLYEIINNGGTLKNELKLLLNSFNLQIKNIACEIIEDEQIKVQLKLMLSHDYYTALHLITSMLFMLKYSSFYKFNYSEMKLMGYMLVLHDIGKLYIPSQILQKKEQLTDNEYDLIHMHPIYSYNIISTLKLPSIVAQTALFHHENINGTGYPYNIKICNNYVKLVSIIDIFDALVNDRPYKKSIDFYSAYDILFKMNIDITLAKKFITSII